MSDKGQPTISSGWQISEIHRINAGESELFLDVCEFGMCIPGRLGKRTIGTVSLLMRLVCMRSRVEVTNCVRLLGAWLLGVIGMVSATGRVELKEEEGRMRLLPFCRLESVIRVGMVEESLDWCEGSRGDVEG
jgi:hypothetical protein